MGVHGWICARVDHPIQLWILQPYAYLHTDRPDSHGTLSTENLVLILSYGDDDTIHLQDKKSLGKQGRTPSMMTVSTATSVIAVVLMPMMVTSRVTCRYIDTKKSSLTAAIFVSMRLDSNISCIPQTRIERRFESFGFYSTYTLHTNCIQSHNEIGVSLICLSRSCMLNAIGE